MHTYYQKMNKEIKSCYDHIIELCDKMDELQLSELKERNIFDTELLNCQNRNIEWFEENKHICKMCSKNRIITCDNDKHAEHCNICQDQVYKIELIKKIRKWLCKRFETDYEYI